MLTWLDFTLLISVKSSYVKRVWSSLTVTVGGCVNLNHLVTWCFPWSWWIAVGGGGNEYQNKKIWKKCKSFWKKWEHFEKSWESFEKLENILTNVKNILKKWEKVLKQKWEYFENVDNFLKHWRIFWNCGKGFEKNWKYIWKIGEDCEISEKVLKKKKWEYFEKGWEYFEKVEEVLAQWCAQELSFNLFLEIYPFSPLKLPSFK